MDNSTKQALAQMSQAVPQLLQAATQYHLENKRLEARQEAELKAAEARYERFRGADGEQPAPRERRNERTERPRERPPESTAGDTESGGQSIAELKAETDCDLCRSVLDRIEPLSGSRREKAIAEYGRLQQAVDDDAGQDELQAVIRESDVLRELLEQELKADAA